MYAAEYLVKAEDPNAISVTYSYFSQECDNVNQEKLKQGLIYLSRHIKAKDGRKVYFFIGVVGSGKQEAMQALQQHKVQKPKAQTSFRPDDKRVQVSDGKPALPQILAKPSYLLFPSDQQPMVRDGFIGQAYSPYLYYPPPNKPPYQSIVFAAPEALFSQPSY